MAGFSQSFLLGDCTLESLENQATKKSDAQQRKLPSTPGRSSKTNGGSGSSQTGKRQNSDDQQQLEVIDESPTSSARTGTGTGTHRRQKSVRERLKTIGTQSRSRKALKRHKSDSVVAKTGGGEKQQLKSKSESREQINAVAVEELGSELFRSDVCFGGASGTTQSKTAGKENREQVVRQQEEINISALLLDTDLNVDVTNRLNPDNEDRPAVSPTKKPRHSQQIPEDMFGSSNFSMDLLPRSQSLLVENPADPASSPKQAPDGNNEYESMFDQSAFTLDVAPPVDESLDRANRTLKDCLASEDLRELSELQESLRVREDDLEEGFGSLIVENVSFTQVPIDSNGGNLQRGLVEKIASIRQEVLVSLSQTRETAASQKPISVSIRKEESQKSAMSLSESKNPRLVASWGLPEAVTKAYARKGVTELFQWQADCLSQPKVLLDCANLVYRAPTSGGKTLVSEFLLAKTVVERKRKAILILPFVAVAREKMFYLQELLSPAGVRVEGFFGGHSPPGGFDSVDIAVCTIEKANSITNRLLEQQKLADVGLVVVDEVHLISDPSRGYILELLLTKIRFAAQKLNERIQIVAMSATIPNVELLTDWLEAEQFETDFRPVQLQEMLKLGTCLYDNRKKFVRRLDTSSFKDVMPDQDQVAQLCLETILEGCSVIVFCPSKDRCEKLTLHLAEFIYVLTKSETDLGKQLRTELNPAKLQEAVGLLKNCPTGLDQVLGKTAHYGVAYHHAGLTADERDIIESCFKSGMVRIIVATSTLSSGVNLPARRVIIRTPLFGGGPMSSLTYRQMIGRAGRKGQDTMGESILMCDSASSKAGWSLVEADLTPIGSCLDKDGYSHLKRAILEVIAAGVASTPSELEGFVNCTLYSREKRDQPFKFNTEILHQPNPVRWTRANKSESVKDPGSESSSETHRDPIGECIRFLLEYEFIRVQADADGDGEALILCATQLGKACLAASMPPRDGFLLFSELQKSRQCFVLETELHAIYLVTPYSVAYQWQNINWMSYLERWEKLSAAEKRVGDLVGIREAFLVKAIRGKVDDHQALQIHKRFYTALALQELVNEVPLSEVASKFCCTRGLLQSLQQVAATFAGIVTAFCTALNWNLLALIVSQYRERLFFGIQPDLMDLMRIPSLNGQRARLLFNGGIVGLVELANSDPLILERILYGGVGFETEQRREGEDEFEARKRMNTRNMYVTGRSGLTVPEAARLMIREARNFIQLETGIHNPDWNETETIDKEQTETIAESEPQLEVQAESKPTDAISENSKQATANSFEVSEAESNQDIECFHNSLIMNFSHVLSEDKDDSTRSGSTKFDSINIVDVCADRKLFQSFRDHLSKTTSISIAFGISKFDSAKSVIGGNLLINQQSSSENEEIRKNFTFISEDNLYMTGVAFTFPETNDSQSANVVYYMSLRKCATIRSEEKQRLVGELFFKREDLTVDLYDAKEQIKMGYRTGLLTMNQELIVGLRDPKVACWLLQTEDKMIPLAAMVQQYCPELTAMCQLAGHSTGSSSPALNYNSSIDARIRCTVESLLVNYLIRAQVDQLGELEERSEEMVSSFCNREMPVHGALARMEMVGFPVDGRKLSQLIERLQKAKERISDRVRTLNGGRRLDFSSTSEVAAVLKIARDPKSGRTKTNRQVLEKIDSPLAALVIAYRKIESNLSRTIEPLFRTIRNEKRIFGNSFCYTTTGRISMHEPNLQTVVKDFKVEIDPNHVETFSCRSTFSCLDSTKTLLSADFCQLELCVLTHLSQDRKLLAVMNGRKDVFRGIAAKWSHIPNEDEVSDDVRNYTKAIVYGVIYGMGAKSMAAELHVDEDTARTLMEQFHSTYPEIRRYTDKVIQITRERGYIETLTGRRRYLPAINSTDQRRRSEAERQAVCTTVQGSAADILKNAILRMSRNLRKYRSTLHLGQVELVLHMHDELIFEVPSDQMRKVAKILKSSMENCAKLSLPLRVKVKSGPSWGEMKEIHL
ncbi:DNA polymerase theta [Uranotaenia lowii]|uniref:DNA polymerase theta n=1 Tax=Uranotaenia lowii TaxID=190385 RepID=UPI0024786DD9|nr:DNA polymerase theta [Uranotaenia lowii]XP_055612162.1 DNA polymerase theta [Uranotaenia lowii]